jgi:hypothetical protein
VSGPSPPRAPGDARGRHRLLLGGLLGVAGALCAVVVPAALVIGAAPGQPTLSGLSAGGIGIATAALLVGAALLLVSLLAYRSAFRILRSADRRFRYASTLCLVGTLGLLLLVAAILFASGSFGPLSTCLAADPGHALGCYRANAPGDPYGALLGLGGFALAWLGSLGIVAGLAWEGRRIGSAALGGGAAVYALSLLVLVGPFAALLGPVPGIGLFVYGLPVLATLAPALVVAGTRRSSPPGAPER